MYRRNAGTRPEVNPIFSRIERIEIKGGCKSICLLMFIGLMCNVRVKNSYKKGKEDGEMKLSLYICNR